MRIKLRTFLILIALTACGMGAEVVRRRYSFYRERASWHSRWEAYYLDRAEECELAVKGCEATLEEFRRQAETDDPEEREIYASAAEEESADCADFRTTANRLWTQASGHEIMKRYYLTHW